MHCQNCPLSREIQLQSLAFCAVVKRLRHSNLRGMVMTFSFNHFLSIDVSEHRFMRFTRRGFIYFSNDITIFVCTRQDKNPPRFLSSRGVTGPRPSFTKAHYQPYCPESAICLDSHVLSCNRMCFLTIECVLLPSNVSSYMSGERHLPR